MKIKCEYCGSFIDDTDEKCQFCGAVNSHLVRKATGIPETMDELLAFAEEHNLPLAQMHYHIGTDYKGAKAIGIYKDEETGNFIVYKNKADGTRAVRYEGKDEKYAVNEIYQKMKTDMIRQREAGKQFQSSPPNRNNRKKSGPNLITIILIILIVLVVFGSTRSCGRSSSGSGSGLYDAVPGYSSNYYDYDDDDSGSSWWDSNDSGSSWDSDDSWNDNWNSSNWNWGSNSWNSGSSNWNSNW